MVLLKCNVALSCKFLSSKQHRLIRFRILMRSQDTQSCKAMSTQSKLKCMVVHIHTYIHTALVVDTSRQVLKYEL